MTKHILIAVAGTTPQIVTESIYAFKHQQNIEIDNVLLLTTAAFHQHCVNALLFEDEQGFNVIQRLQKDWQLSDIEFNNDCILRMQSEDQEIKDVTTEKDVKAAAEFILRLIQQLTLDDENCLHVSLAGGRKTLSYYLGYAMSLYARRQDTLHHVFVDSAYHHSEFYYPTPLAKMIYTEQGMVDASLAKVSLVSVPFIKLRGFLPKSQLEKALTFSESAHFYDMLNSPVQLIVNIPGQSICCSGIEIKLSPANFAFYLMLVEDLMGAHEGFDIPTASSPDKTTALCYLNARLRIEGLHPSFVSLNEALDYAESSVLTLKQNEIDGLREGLKKSFFNARKNEIGRGLREKLPEIVAEHYDIESLDKAVRPGATKKVSFFGIDLEPSDVSIIEH